MVAPTIKSNSTSVDLNLANQVLNLIEPLACFINHSITFNSLSPTVKSDGSQVTTVDTCISKFLMAELPKLFDLPVVSEENTSSISALQRNPVNSYWLVDPIDGTENMIKGHPGYGVCIALIIENQPVMGIIYAPDTRINTVYFAVKGQGAFQRPIGSTEITVLQSRNSGPAEAKDFATYFNINAGELTKQKEFLERFGLSHVQQTKIGACLKYTDLVEGKFDLAGGWKAINIWDIAAADCIVSESGGIIVDVAHGKPLSYALTNLRVESAIALSKGLKHSLLDRIVVPPAQQLEQASLFEHGSPITHVPAN